jgi:hypothetical protein
MKESMAIVATLKVIVQIIFGIMMVSNKRYKMVYKYIKKNHYYNYAVL